MAVLPACNLVDFDRLKRVVGAGHAELAHEEEFKTSFRSVRSGQYHPLATCMVQRLLWTRH